MTRAPRAKPRPRRKPEAGPGGLGLPQLLLLAAVVAGLGLILLRLDFLYFILYVIFLLLMGGMIRLNVLTHRQNLAAALEARQAAAQALRRQPRSLLLQERYSQAARYFYALQRSLPGSRPAPSTEDELRIQIELHELTMGSASPPENPPRR